jgi:hypothetical protein
MDGFQDGKVSQLEHVFIRGSRVRFMIIPDMLKNAPMFKRLEARIRVSTLTPAPPSFVHTTFIYDATVAISSSSWHIPH